MSRLEQQDFLCNALGVVRAVSPEPVQQDRLSCCPGRFTVPRWLTAALALLGLGVAATVAVRVAGGKR